MTGQTSQKCAEILDKELEAPPTWRSFLKKIPNPFEPRYYELVDRSEEEHQGRPELRKIKAHLDYGDDDNDMGRLTGRSRSADETQYDKRDPFDTFSIKYEDELGTKVLFDDYDIVGEFGLAGMVIESDRAPHDTLGYHSTATSTLAPTSTATPAIYQEQVATSKESVKRMWLWDFFLSKLKPKPNGTITSMYSSSCDGPRRCLASKGWRSQRSDEIFEESPCGGRACAVDARDIARAIRREGIRKQGNTAVIYDGMGNLSIPLPVPEPVTILEMVRINPIWRQEDILSWDAYRGELLWKFGDNVTFHTLAQGSVETFEARLTPSPDTRAWKGECTCHRTSLPQPRVGYGDVRVHLGVRSWWQEAFWDGPWNGPWIVSWHVMSMWVVVLIAFAVFEWVTDGRGRRRREDGRMVKQRRGKVKSS
jgi:hypothetical protein